MSSLHLYKGTPAEPIENKDRGVAEPPQLYTGRDRLLYKVVIFTIDKNGITGYLSTPKVAASVFPARP
jgi:hypothetical protein